MFRLMSCSVLLVVVLIGCGDESDDLGGFGGAAGSAGSGGTGGSGGDEVILWPCTDQGIRDAIEVGGGPHTFACDGPTVVTTGPPSRSTTMSSSTVRETSLSMAERVTESYPCKVDMPPRSSGV